MSVCVPVTTAIRTTLQSFIVASLKRAVFQGGREEAQILKMAANRCGVLICDY